MVDFIKKISLQTLSALHKWLRKNYLTGVKFPDPLIRGVLIKRYKRFLADITLENSDIVTAHCANSGSMMGLIEPGAEAWLSLAHNPKRKLKFTWELVRNGDGLVGINTSLANAIVSEAIECGAIAGLAGYDSLRREVRYGQNSRIDILLESDGRPPCYVEIKSVTLKRDDVKGGLAEFPDSVTARGTKHLNELSAMVAGGARAVMLYLVQREDCDRFAIATDIDPAYGAALIAARAAGVETFCHACRVNTDAIELDRALPLDL